MINRKIKIISMSLILLIRKKTGHWKTCHVSSVSNLTDSSLTWDPTKSQRISSTYHISSSFFPSRIFLWLSEEKCVQRNKIIFVLITYFYVILALSLLEEYDYIDHYMIYIISFYRFFIRSHCSYIDLGEILNKGVWMIFSTFKIIFYVNKWHKW